MTTFHPVRRFITPAELSERWGGIPLGTLANWRSRGTGPKFHRFGGSVRYALTEVEQYESEAAA